MKSNRSVLLPLILIFCILLCSCTENTNNTVPSVTPTPLPPLSDNTVSDDDAVHENAALSDNSSESIETVISSNTAVSDNEAVSDNTVSENTISGNVVSDNTVSDNSSASKEPDLSRVTLWPEEKTMYAIAQVNIRKGPSVEFERVGLLERAESVTVLGQDKDGWYEINKNGQICFVSNNFLSDTAPADPTPTPIPPVEEQPVSVPTPTPTPVPVPAVSAPAGVILVGDSRCVGMREATGGGGVSWICENGKEYEWFKGTALPQLDPIVGRGTRVVICLGVNDTDHAYSYAPLINQKAAEWAARGAATYFVSVNPVGDNPYTNMDNVVNFNNIMINNLSGVKYIDTCNTLIANGYNCYDGLHYDVPTYQYIFQLILGGL